MKTKKEKKIKEKKPLSKKKKILRAVGFSFLGLFAALVLFFVITFIVLWNDPVWQSHLKAAYSYACNSTKELEQEKEKISEENRNNITNAGLYIDESVELAFENGEISPEQFQQILSHKMTLDQAKEQNRNGQTQTNNNVTKPDPEQTGDNPVQTDPNVPDDTQENTENIEEPSPEINNVPDDVTQNNAGDNQQNPVENTPDNIQNNRPDNKPIDNTDNSSNIHQTPGTTVIPIVPDNKTDTKQPVASSEETDEKVAELVTKMYVLKNEYIGQINALVSKMSAEFSKLPKEQQTLSSKQSIASKYVSQVNAMEAQCDAQVNSIVSELRGVLKNAGRDTSLADRILSTYASEKENTKAYYIATYGD